MLDENIPRVNEFGKGINCDSLIEAHRPHCISEVLTRSVGKKPGSTGKFNSVKRSVFRL